MSEEGEEPVKKENIGASQLLPGFFLPPTTHLPHPRRRGGEGEWRRQLGTLLLELPPIIIIIFLISFSFALYIILIFNSSTSLFYYNTTATEEQLMPPPRCHFQIGGQPPSTVRWENSTAFLLVNCAFRHNEQIWMLFHEPTFVPLWMFSKNQLNSINSFFQNHLMNWINTDTPTNSTVILPAIQLLDHRCNRLQFNNTIIRLHKIIPHTPLQQRHPAPLFKLGNTLIDVHVLAFVFKGINDK